MAQQGFDERKYFNTEVNVNTTMLDRALKSVPGHLKAQLLDALDHIRKGYFKALYYTHKPNFGRWIFAEKKSGVGQRIRSYRNPRKGDILDMELGVFSRSDVMRVHEQGGVVRAKSGMMAIPTQFALNEFGRLSRTEYKSVRELPGIFRPKGKNYLAKEKAGRIVPMFLLRSSVTLYPRLKFYSTWEHMIGYRNDVLNRSVERALNKE